MPDSQEEFDQAWAEIVEDLTAGPPGPSATTEASIEGPPPQSRPAAAAEEAPATPDSSAGDPGSGDGDGEPGAAGTGSAGTEPDRGNTGSAGTGAGAGSSLESLFEPLRRQRERRAPKPTPEPAPDEFVDSWEDEGHFVPPPPPELPEGTPLERLAWAGVIGGPLIILLIAFTGWDPPNIVGLGAGAATLGGFLTLVWHLPEGRSDGWDDGAQL